MLFTETIAAPITPMGGAVCVIRLSGPDAWDIAGSTVAEPIRDPLERHAYYTHFTNGDDGLIIFFAENRSYTGEPSVEISVHGSPASVESLLRIAYAHGAEPAKPGEFTMRAFLNGKLDLSQAEAVKRIVEAETERQLKSATQVRKGALTELLESVSTPIFFALASIEAHTDFSEEIGEIDDSALIDGLQNSLQSLNDLLETSQATNLIRDGARVAIVGKPNAGKSSLFNAVVGSERAIVTATPGTTRDTIEQHIDLDGYLLILIDTAGVRAGSDQVEAIGIERTKAEIQKADIVWHVYDAAEGWSDQDAEVTAAFEDRLVIVVANKSDLTDSKPTVQGAIPTSATTGAGLDQLLSHTKQHFPADGIAALVNPRQEAVLKKASEAIAEAISTLSEPIPRDLAVVHLREARHQLGLIDGKSADADYLETIFAEFCIGK